MLRASLTAMLLVAGCGSAAHTTGVCDGPCSTSKVRHLVIIVQENHTFDNHFGRYCTGAPAVDCNVGPACCEAAPDLDPSGASPVPLDDNHNSKYDPNHQRDCETPEMDGGKMDGYTNTATCGDPGNLAYADSSTVGPYWKLAGGGALADRYFQPVIGASSANDMYLTRTRFAFDDDDDAPDSIGHECSFIPQTMSFDDPTIVDLLTGAGVSWAWYVGGYEAMKLARAAGKCPDPPDACAAGLSIYPCVFEPADVPIEYQTRFRDDPKYLRDYTQLAGDIDAGRLPQVSWVRAIGYESEHPGLGTTLTAGVAFVESVVKKLRGTTYDGDTLILFTYDEGGGYFDHVSPPPNSVADGQPYGTRVPMLALGPFARANAISHVVMEHSSIVKFIEWNWLGAVGQLQARDAEVNNLGSLLDPALSIPEN